MSLYAPNPQEFPDRLTNMQAAIQNTYISGPPVTVTPTGGTSTSYTYAVVASFGSDNVPAFGATTAGVSTLSASAYNTITWNALQPTNTAPVTYSVYRTVGGVAQGLIASGLTVTSLVDTGLVATTQAVPQNTTSSGSTVEAVTASGAILNGSGIIFINGTGVDAMTLALPTQDGLALKIYCNTAHAHTVTTPSDGINGASHVITFGAAAGNFADLFSFGGSWYVTAELNATVS